MAQWRQAWHVTPRQPKRHALLQLARARQSNSDPHEVGAAQLAEGKQVVVQLEGVSRNHSPYPFLGLELCRQAFQALTGLSNNAVVKANQYAALGLHAWTNTTRYRPTIRENEMREAIWMVIQDLHHQSPYAGQNDPEKWNIPFHHKVCLWRLVKKLHEVHEVDDDKPSIFSADPKY